MRIGDNMVRIVNISKKYILFKVESSRGDTHDVIFNRESYLIKLLFNLTKINVEMNNERLDKVYEGITLTPQELLFMEE